MNDSTNQTQTRAYQNGILAAKGVRWAGKKLKMLDKACVASAKRKEWPGWLGHIPLMSMAAAILALLAYYSLEILFTVGFLVILFTAIENMDGSDLLATFNNKNSMFNDDPLIERTYDGFNAIDDGTPYGESYGTWSDDD